jgi:hypothetical protein
MKDLIDLGNLVFAQLIKEHGELEESRMLFLYGVTTSTRWTILDSAKWVLIDRDGLLYNFEDSVLADLANTWTTISESMKAANVKKYLDKERSTYESSQPKPGEIREWFGQETPWREINL